MDALEPGPSAGTRLDDESDETALLAVQGPGFIATV